MKTAKLMRGDDLKSSSRLRGTAKLSESVHQQLNMYAIAAGAAGVGVLALIPPAECVLTASAALAGALALSEPAEAKIVYTKTHVVIESTQCSPSFCNGHFSFDLNHDGKPDLGLFVSAGSGVGGFFAEPAEGNGIEEGTLGHGYAAALKAGENIGHAEQFNQASRVLMRFMGHARRDCSVCSGYWSYVQPRYLGVAFPDQREDPLWLDAD